MLVVKKKEVNQCSQVYKALGVEVKFHKGDLQICTVRFPKSDFFSVNGGFSPQASLPSTDQVLHSLYQDTPVSNALCNHKDAFQLVSSGVLVVQCRRPEHKAEFSQFLC